MTIEKSHGKARPTLPRASDLGTVPQPEAPRTATRGPDGRFAPGNRTGRGKGAKRQLARLMGTDSADPITALVASSAAATYRAHIQELPNQGSMVSSLVSLASRHEALSAYFHSVAAKAGLGTTEGVAALTEASKHGQRAERLLVTALDVSKALALATKSEPVDVLDAYMATSRRG